MIRRTNSGVFFSETARATMAYTSETNPKNPTRLSIFPRHYDSLFMLYLMFEVNTFTYMFLMASVRP